jgi:hypothetical protein
MTMAGYHPIGLVLLTYCCSHVTVANAFDAVPHEGLARLGAVPTGGFRVMSVAPACFPGTSGLPLTADI